MYGGGALHGYAQGHAGGGGTIYCCKARTLKLLAPLYATTHSDTAHTMAPGTAQHTRGCLTHNRLSINVSLARDNKVGILNECIELREVEDEVDTRHGYNIKQCAEAKGRTSRSAHAPICGVVRAHMSRNGGGKVARSPIQALDIGIRSTLLSGIDLGSTTRTAERVIHIDSGRNIHTAQQGSTALDTFRTLEDIHRRGKLPAMCIQEAEAQGAQQSSAAVVRGATAKAEDYPTAAVAYSIGNHNTRAEGVCNKRVTLRHVEQREATCRGEGDNGRAILNCILCLERAHKRVVGEGCDTLATNALRQPLASIRDRHGRDVGITHNIAKAVCEGLICLASTERPLERVESYNNTHRRYGIKLTLKDTTKSGKMLTLWV